VGKRFCLHHIINQLLIPKNPFATVHFLMIVYLFDII
jgi:hypothetical protein